MKKIIILFCIFLLSFFSLTANADLDSVITQFDSNIDVRVDSVISVTETIHLNSNGNDVRHGIYRDFPVLYKKPDGGTARIDFKLLAATLNGVPVPYRSYGIPNGVRIYLGDPQRILAAGNYIFVLHYTAGRELGFFSDHDELYWNVTGNNWRFPIQQATATVTLPPGAANKLMGMKAYTGSYGERGTAYQSQQLPNGTLVFSTTKPLAPYQGFTIVVGWPKGFVTQPTTADNYRYLISDNLGLIILFGGTLLVFCYYFFEWLRHRPRYKNNIVIPEFTPPAGFSPGEIRYIKNKGFDGKILTTAIINMAVKGFLVIEQKDNVDLWRQEMQWPGSNISPDEAKKNDAAAKNPLFAFIMRGKGYLLTKKTADMDMLAPEEKAIAQSLFGESDTFIVDSTSQGLVKSCIRAIKKILKDLFQKKYFVTNTIYLICGALLSVACAGAALAAMNILDLFYLGGFFVLVFINALFFFLLRTYTVEGHELLLHIKGFKMFLEATEKERLNFLNPPDRTPELFEKYLPYALALDVEQKWSEQFDKVFQSLESAGHPYAPSWCPGSAVTGVGFAAALSTSLGSSIASASPGSSSGFGGGGGSGGGGGGGGGGGW